MNNKKFSVTFVLGVDKNNNILSSDSNSHSEDIFDLIMDTFYDTDDITIDNLYVKERS
jgi:hypothetical protein|tara:strand:- start:937 stop:1110 length:174 start_codon:yes stop_codon:yes gene_type:complete